MSRAWATISLTLACAFAACTLYQATDMLPLPFECGCTIGGKLGAAAEGVDAKELLKGGKIAAAEGADSRAIPMLAQAVEKAKMEGNAELAIEAVTALASALTMENSCRDALAPLQQVMMLPGVSPEARLRLQLVLADCQLRAGRPRRAGATLQGDFRALPDGNTAATMLRSRALLAQATLESQDFDEALRELSVARQDALAEPRTHAEFLLLMAAGQGEMGDVAAAQNTLSEFVADLERTPKERGGQAVAGLRLLAGLGDDASLAERLRTLALSQLRLDDARGRSQAMGFAGQVAEKQGRLTLALQRTRDALLPSSGRLEPGLEMLWNWQLGRLLERTGDLPGADTRFRIAFALASGLHFESAMGAGLPTFCRHERQGDLLRDYADFLLRHGRSVRSSDEAAWREALTVMNSQRELRIRDYLQDQCLAALVGREQAVETVAPGSAVLHVLVLPERTEVLLQTGARIFRHVEEAPENVIRDQVRAFRENLTDATGTGYRASGKKLYDWLLGPFSDQLAESKVDTLVVAAEGELQLVPFSALYDGEGFLIERMAVATTPSLHLLDTRMTRAVGASILAAGLKMPMRVDDVEFPALSGVDTELKALQSLPASTTLMLDGAFTPESFKRTLTANSYAVVHVASHAEVGIDPEDFFIVTGGGKLDVDGLDEAIRPTLYRRQPLELLVLSACETATGDDRIALGLAGVAMKAGARSTLASLWCVNDDSSTELMSAFYKNWFRQELLTKAQALRQAQLSLLRDLRYRHPRSWASFVLIGNWR